MKAFRASGTTVSELGHWNLSCPDPPSNFTALKLIPARGVFATPHHGLTAGRVWTDVPRCQNEVPSPFTAL